MCETPRWSIELACHQYSTTTREACARALDDAIAEAVDNADARESWENQPGGGRPFAIAIHRLHPDGTSTAVRVPPQYSEMASVLTNRVDETEAVDIALERDRTGIVHVRNPFRFPNGSAMPMALVTRKNETVLTDRGATLAYLTEPRPLEAPMSQALQAAAIRAGIEYVDVPIVRDTPLPKPDWKRLTDPTTLNTIVGEGNARIHDHAIETTISDDGMLAAVIALGQTLTRLCELKRATRWC